MTVRRGTTEKRAPEITYTPGGVPTLYVTVTTASVERLFAILLYLFEIDRVSEAFEWKKAALNIQKEIPANIKIIITIFPRSSKRIKYRRPVKQVRYFRNQTTCFLSAI